jgi:ParB-like chromosome segregation protein Spo0J
MFDYVEAEVSGLIPYALNARTHSDSQIKQIAASIRLFGFTNPVLIDEDNNLIAGHGRLAAASVLKMETVPAIVVTGLDEAKRRALIIADNRHGETSGWDYDLLTEELASLRDSIDIEAMGYSTDDLAKLLGEMLPEGELSEEQAVDKWQLLTEYENEDDLARAYEVAQKEGLTCKIIM